MLKQDLTAEAKAVIKLVRYFDNKGELVTLEHCRNIFRGADITVIRDRGQNRLAEDGGGKHLNNELLEQLFKRLCFLEGLDEVSTQNGAGWHLYYCKVGSQLLTSTILR